MLIRGAIPKLERPPVACFFLAPPTSGSKVASKLAPRWIFRILTGEMGRMLADTNAMASIPIPDVPTYIFAGTGDRRDGYGRRGSENDGILGIEETRMPGMAGFMTVPSVHTYIMNHPSVLARIVEVNRHAVGKAVTS
ncbi:MAG: hypothetical protein MZU95_10715 [Desulfomicrobium escambiense]|nr:hypothetical protein [Desulfomicrobium escambiense]